METERITIYICRCCGKVATPSVQPALVPGRSGAIIVECREFGCSNWKATKDTRDNVSQWYTAVSVDSELAGRLIEVVDAA